MRNERTRGGSKKSYQEVRHAPRFPTGSRVVWGRKTWETGIFADDPVYGITYHLFRFKDVKRMHMGKVVGTAKMCVFKWVHESELKPAGGHIG